MTDLFPRTILISTQIGERRRAIPEAGIVELAIILNPAAGRGSGARAWNGIAADLEKERITYHLCRTSGPGDATRLTTAALRKGAVTVVSIGGDGTANEVVNGFFERGTRLNPHARVAFVAAGTGNDVGRAFPHRDLDLLTTLRGTGTTWVDVLQARYRSVDSGLIERYVLSHVGVGLFADAVAISSGLKRALGRFAYTGAGVLSVVRHQPMMIRYACDDAAAIAGSFNLIVVANGRYAGGGMLVAPPASMEDGLLDVIALEGASKSDLVFRILPGAYRGWHMRHRAVRHTRARAVRIESDADLRIEIDGELVGSGPIDIEVCPRALPVCSLQSLDGR